MTTNKSGAGIFLDVIIAHLAPMFLFAANGDTALARAAAIETVETYQARNQPDLLSIAQMVAFGLAALGSLSLAMADDISTSMTLRLRANAVASSRAGEACRRALAQQAPVRPRPEPATSDEDLSEVFSIAAAQQVRQHRAETAAPAIAPAPPATGQDRERRNEWAAALADVAAEVSASLSALSPEDRRLASAQAAALFGGPSATSHTHPVPSGPT